MTTSSTSNQEIGEKTSLQLNGANFKIFEEPREGPPITRGALCGDVRLVVAKPGVPGTLEGRSHDGDSDIRSHPQL